MDTGLILLLVFFIGTVGLLFSRHERYLGLFFIIRTRYFIPVIDAIASIAPKLWGFLADLSIVAFFGGLGAAYLSRYRKSEDNLNKILVIIGSAAILLWSPGIIPGFLLFILLLVSVRILSNLKSIAADFMFSALLTALVFTKLVSLIALTLGSGLTVSWFVALIEGFLGIPPLLIGMFMMQAYQIVFMGSEMPGISPMLPTVQEGNIGVAVPGYPIFVPIAYAVIAFAVLLFSHEFAHGVLARVHKIKLKSTGLLTVGVIPIGAFVEPDEEELKRKKSIEKMHVYSAGSFANIVVCVLAVPVLLFISSFLVSFDGLMVMGLADNTTASGILENGTIIYSVNGVVLDSGAAYSRLMLNVSPGDSITLGTDRGEFNLLTMPDPETGEKAYIGILLKENIKSNYGLDLGILNFVWTSLIWIIFFNFNVALVNLLPLAPFDGAKMLLEIMNVFRISPETARNVVYGIFMLNIFLLVINALPLFSMLLSGL